MPSECDITKYVKSLKATSAAVLSLSSLETPIFLVYHALWISNDRIVRFPQVGLAQLKNS